MSATKGSSGFGSESRLVILSSTLEIVSAGDHLSFRISRQMRPDELILG